MISSRRLVETLDRLTSRSVLISSASSGDGETNKQRVNLGHGPIDAPGLTHLAPVKHELLRGRCEVHGTFRLNWMNDLYRNLTCFKVDKQGHGTPAHTGEGKIEARRTRPSQDSSITVSRSPSAFLVERTFSSKSRAAELMQYRSPVGSGPSSNTCPR